MGLAFSPDGSLLANGNWDQTIKLWDVVSGNVLKTLVGHTDQVQTVAWSPDGQTLASAALDYTIGFGRWRGTPPGWHFMDIRIQCSLSPLRLTARDC